MAHIKLKGFSLASRYLKLLELISFLTKFWVYNGYWFEFFIFLVKFADLDGLWVTTIPVLAAYKPYPGNIDRLFLEMDFNRSFLVC